MDRDQHIPTVRDRVHRQRLGRTTPNVQEHKRWGGATLSAWSRTEQSVSLSSAEAEFYAPTPGISEGMVTNHLLKEQGLEVTLVSHVDSQSAKVWASKRGLGWMKHVMLECVFVQDVVEKKQTTLACVNTNSKKADLMTKCHTFEAHMKGCAMFGSETQERRRENSLETVPLM